MRARGSWLLPLALAIVWLSAIIAYLIWQAVPMGGLEGIALAEETGRALSRARIQLSLVDVSTDEVPGYFVLRTKRDGTFRLARIPAGRYRLEASSRAHRLRPTSVTVEEGKVRRVTLELGPVAPYFSINIAQNTVTPEERPQVIAHGFLRSPTLEFRLYRVDPTDLLTRHHGSLSGVLRSEEPPEHVVLEGNPALTLAGRSSAQITERDVEGIFHQRFDLPTPPPGIYLVVAKADSIEQTEWAVVTKLGLILKRWGDQGLAYVTDLKSGDPVPGARVEFSAIGQGSVSGVTDEDGIFQAQLPATRPGAERRLLARAEKDDSQAFLMFYSYGEDGEGQERVYCYTDRPVYRPGHLVHFKGIARRFADDRYAVLADRPVEVRVWDSRESLVYRGRLRTNGFGSFHGELRLNEEAATGLYRVVNVLDGREHDSYFKVAEYRKPEYTVSVATAKKRYVRGETIEVRAAAQYYFGAPVAGAEVTYLVQRSPYWFYPRGEEDEELSLEEEYGYDYGEVIEQGTTRTDGDGEARFRVPTKLPLSLDRQREAEEAAAQDYRYTIEVTVTDPSRKAVTGSGSTLVTQGEFKLYLRPLRYIAVPGQEVEIEVSAVDYESRPVAGAQVDVAAGWHRWEEESKFEAEARGQVTTDGRGRAVFRFTPESEGTYRVEGRARDRFGNGIFDTGYLWVTSSQYADFAMPYPDLEIVPDKRAYRSGETAVLLINSKLKGATALVTVEGLRLYQHWVVKLGGGSTRVELPIRPEYAPNFFFCVSLVRNKQFAIQQKRIKVSVEERRLRVSVEPNKQLYRPGEQAAYRIRTADWRGKPVSAELSMGVVDESIYAIQEEMAEPVLRFFYPPRYNSVYTSYSFAQIYLDADKEPVGIKVRRRFPDTAYWNPMVVTGPDGEADVSFEMPDTLTTWRATVRGVTLATEVGEAVAKVKCSKDLLVRLEMPRFLTQKDEATIAAVAHNYTNVKQDLELWLTAPRLNLPRRPKAGERLRFALAPEGTRRQDWWVEATAPGEGELTAFLRSRTGLSDAMALTLPVLPHGRERVEWRSGAAVNTTTERLPVRADSVLGASVLRVRLAPSLASVLLGALEYLAAYPYGCTEQTMSAFLPDVVVARTLRELDLPNERLERELPDMVQKGLNRLYGFQHDDGGWGWWRYDQSDPWMTAYVVFGLLTAKENGFSVNERFLSSGLGWLRRHAQQPLQLSPERAYVLYVLALAGRSEFVSGQLTHLYRNLYSLNAYSTALLASALLAQQRTTEARVAASRLWKQASETQALVSWEGMEGWGRGGSVETTALAFKALREATPDDARLFRVVRWLVLHRQGNHWVSTRDTAFALYALTDFLKRSQELRPDYRATVSLNGRELIARQVTSDDIFGPEIEVSASGRSLQIGDNTLEISKQGPGNLYYTLTLRQFVGQEDLAKVITDAGISVGRKYHSMVSARDPRTRVFSISPSPRATTSFRSGESVLVRLTITSPREYEYVVIEDPIPAGCEVAEQGDLEPWEWDRWWSDMDVRDEKVAIFARRLPAGTSTIEYHLRPQIPGAYHVMPTEVYAMYNPDLRGSGEETKVSLR